MNTVIVAVAASGVAAVLTLGLVVVLASAGVRGWSRWRGGLLADAVVVAESPPVAQFRGRDGLDHRVTLRGSPSLRPGAAVVVRYPPGNPDAAVLAESPR